MMKVICAGAPKTGTKSIAKALRILGYDAVYDAEEAMNFGLKEWENILDGKQRDMKALMDTVYSNVEAVVDMPHSRFFDEFLKHWPNAKVILTLRDEQEWFQSYDAMFERGKKSYGYLYWLRWFSPSLRKLLKWRYKLATATVGGTIPCEFVWKSWFRHHNSCVRYIVSKSQLLEYKIADGWEPLCKFLDKPIPTHKFPFKNRSGGGSNIEDKIMKETRIAQKIKQEINSFFAMMSLVLVMILSYCLLI